MQDLNKITLNYQLNPIHRVTNRLQHLQIWASWTHKIRALSPKDREKVGPENTHLWNNP